MPQTREQGHCRICHHAGNVEKHHIISRHRCWVIGRLDLLDAPGNLVHLCVECHGHTAASLVRNILIDREATKSSRLQKSNYKSKAEEDALSHSKKRDDLECSNVRFSIEQLDVSKADIVYGKKIVGKAATVGKLGGGGQEWKEVVERDDQKSRDAMRNMRGKRREQKQKKVGWRVRCFRCGSLTHLATGCTETRDVEGRKIPALARKNHWLVKRRGISCFRCGLTGHRWDKCTSSRHIDGRPLSA